MSKPPLPPPNPLLAVTVDGSPAVPLVDAPAELPRGFAILLGLNALKKHIYAGTVSYATVQERRRRNRVARTSRQINRRARM